MKKFLVFLILCFPTVCFADPAYKITAINVLEKTEQKEVTTSYNVNSLIQQRDSIIANMAVENKKVAEIEALIGQYDDVAKVTDMKKLDTPVQENGLKDMVTIQGIGVKE